MTGPILPAPVRRTLSLARKETFQIIRDPSSVLIAFILPLILLGSKRQAGNFLDIYISVVLVIKQFTPFLHIF